MQYVAFLLGVNLGTRTVKMAQLKKLLESMGCTDVATVLASGNVVFTAKKEKTGVLARKLELALEKEFCFKIGVIVRTIDEIRVMVKAAPFKKVRMTKDIRRYVTFLAENPASHTPPRSVESGYRILRVTDGEAYSVLDLSKFSKTPDVMKLLGRAYGKKITTRNWNTVEKIAVLARNS